MKLPQRGCSALTTCWFSIIHPSAPGWLGTGLDDSDQAALRHERRW